MFKVTEQLTNVRPSKTEEPELTTTPTSGNIKVNAPGATKLGVSNGDHLAVVKANDGNGEAFYAVKGHAATETESQLGSVLSSPTGKMGGSLQMSSENAYRELGGNKENRKVYSIGEGVEDGGKTYFRLNFVREEAKAPRTEKTA